MIGVYSEEKVQEMTKLLKEQELMAEDDKVINNVSGDRYSWTIGTRGHLYFTLKDENCLIKCVMFKNYADKLDFVPKDGMKVLVRGKISVYEATGSYQIYVEKMEMDGIGNLYLMIEKTKKKLV